jgi:hypothetical protein
MKAKLSIVAATCIFSALVIFAPSASGQGSWYQCRSWGENGPHETIYVTPFMHTDAAASTIHQAYFTYMHRAYPVDKLIHESDYCRQASGDAGQRAFSLSTEEKQWAASKWEVIHINWTYTPGGSAVAGPPPRTYSSASSAPPPQEIPKTGNGWAQQAGKVHHYYCSSDQGQPTMYVSAAFDTTDMTPGNMGAAYKQFLVQKYSYSGPVACFGAYPTLDAVRADEQSRVTNMRATKKWKIVETGWTWAGSAP